MKSVLVRMPEELYESLKVAAGQQRRSLNSQIVAMLSWLAPPLGTEPVTVIPTIVAVQEEPAVDTTPPEYPANILPPGALEGIKEGIKAVREGRVTPWPEVKKELDIRPLCTCTPAERGKKGKHGKWCPAKGT